MPGGDGTGPVWAQGRFWRCRRMGAGGYGRGFGFRSWQRVPYDDPIVGTKDEQIKILNEELAELNKEKERLAQRLKELES
jgi:hypothetical protein